MRSKTVLKQEDGGHKGAFVNFKRGPNRSLKIILFIELITQKNKQKNSFEIN